jgi:hypothetical protein
MSEDPRLKSPEERYEGRFTRALGKILKLGTLGVGMVVVIYLIMRFFHC